MRFRTTQLSSPDFEHLGLRHITVSSPHLLGRGDIVVHCPETNRTDLPIAVLLHGVYGSAWVWAMRGGASQTADLMLSQGAISPMILAMPSDGLWKDGSFYLPHHGYDFASWIVEDVIDAVRLLVPQAADSTRTAIGGLSMGGFGALRLGALNSEKFCAISAHSAITHLEQAKHFTNDVIEGISNLDQSVLKTILANADSLPALRFDCGKDDLLIEYNRSLHSELTKAGIQHEYEEFEGAHEWPYWQKHLRETLLFFQQAFERN